MAATMRKLVVEVVEARNLLPKDGTGTSSPYVRVDFDGQRRKTRTAQRDLNPTWNEALEFDVAAAADLDEPLEVDVFHDVRVGPSRRNNFLGRVRLDSRQFCVRKGEEALMHFPLEKKSFFSWVRGEIGLKVYYVDDPVPAPAAAAAAAAAAEPDNSAANDSSDEPNSVHENCNEPAAPPLAEAPNAEKPAEAPPAEAEADGATAAASAATSELEETAPAAVPTENSEKPAEESDRQNMEAKEEAPPEPIAAAAVETRSEPEKEAAGPEWAPQRPRRMKGMGAEIAREGPAKYDLVDKMQYLFVRVVRARGLPAGAAPRVRVAAHGRRASTREARRAGPHHEWDRTFAFAREPYSGDPAAAPAASLEVSVWDLPPGEEDDHDADADDAEGEERHLLGALCFDASEVPLRDPPDSPLAPQWYRLEGPRGGGGGGQLMLATWIGTQADESFADAWKADAPPSAGSSRSKVYVSPKLWYLRVTVIEAQDALPSPTRDAAIAVAVRAALGSQVLRTRAAACRGGAPSWNEDLIFVAAEPFGEDERLLLSLEIRGAGKDAAAAAVGSAALPLSAVERRVDDRTVASRWLDVLPTVKKKGGPGQGHGHVPGGRLHVRACLDGGYHVADEAPHACSDYRPAARQLWRAPLGAVELGVVGCRGLLPMRTLRGKGSTDAYAVAKYGPKWARTRTVADSLDPAWNEQYTWPVYDPCTVLTLAVFDESPPSDPDAGPKDPAPPPCSRPMGKVRIRVSTLETDRVYRGSYPLILMLPGGAKRMGEIELAVRFARAGSVLDLVHAYGLPMLPPMHHVRPIPPALQEPLRLLDAAEPRGFSMRKVRANWHRIVAALAWTADAARWVEDTRNWRNPTATALAHGALVLLAWHPDLLLPVLAVHFAAVGAWRYRRRLQGPVPHPCVRVSMAETADREELDEEFDPVPSTRAAEVVWARYDRLRAVGARVQAMLGDVAAQAERVQALVTWRDPRATGMFVAMCLAVAVVLYVVPSRMMAVAAGFYYLRHPMFRDRMPPAAHNFFRRLPALSERII
ncbi:protein QUIRKY-like [Ananas comosus]|uniref:Protein QUIRKY-like n=1 Tax=Ananas comosus TaxID=4615 RepID=A0A6P5FHF8_ANACO|nr:protein QUIRKY-like [Ananas comosus]